MDAPLGDRFERALRDDLGPAPRPTDGVGIAQIRDGKVVSYRDHFDRLQMYEQVGW